MTLCLLSEGGDGGEEEADLLDKPGHHEAPTKLEDWKVGVIIGVLGVLLLLLVTVTSLTLIIRHRQRKYRGNGVKMVPTDHISFRVAGGHKNSLMSGSGKGGFALMGMSDREDMEAETNAKRKLKELEDNCIYENTKEILEDNKMQEMLLGETGHPEEKGSNTCDQA